MAEILLFDSEKEAEDKAKECFSEYPEFRWGPILDRGVNWLYIYMGQGEHVLIKVDDPEESIEGWPVPDETPKQWGVLFLERDEKFPWPDFKATY